MSGIKTTVDNFADLESLSLSVSAPGLDQPVDNKTSAGQVASLVVKAQPGTLYGFTVYNNNAAAQWIQVFDAAVLPANAVVPPLVFEIAAQVGRTIDFGTRGRRFLIGIVIANSTTDVTLTTGAADCIFDAQFV